MDSWLSEVRVRRDKVNRGSSVVVFLDILKVGVSVKWLSYPFSAALKKNSTKEVGHC